MIKWTNYMFRWAAALGFVLVQGMALSQFSIPNTSQQSINFNSFNGAGFNPSPAVGQLDSDEWRITGLSDGNGTFGGTHTTGDFARGASTGGVSTGGIYSFDVGAGDNALGVQPGGTDFAPGQFTLRIQNNTGSTITDIDLNYEIHVYNDQDRANSLNFSYSDDDVSYTSVSGLDFTTPEAADGSPAWVQTDRSTTISGLNISDGALFYLQWSSNDASGSGSRDEIAIDDIGITAIPLSASLVVSTSSLTDFGNVDNGSSSSPQSFTVEGSSLTNDITVTAPAHFEVSLSSGSGFGASVTLPESSGSVATTTIYARFAPSGTAGAISDNIVITTTGALSESVGVSGTANLPNAWINEIHYDNVGADVGEFVEIVIDNSSLYTLSDFTVTLYNGFDGTVYNSETLDNFIEGDTDGDYTLYYWATSLQNATPDPDGLSLDFQGTIIQFLSYEGSFTAVGGVADGLTSTSIGVIEDDATTPIGTSLSLTGSGTQYTDLTWSAEVAETPGSANTGQVLPVLLKDFYGRKNGNAIELIWITTLEVNNEKFIIEKAIDGAVFEAIGEVRGGGTTSDLSTYQFVDRNPAQSNYYRLKQIDYDGKQSISNVIAVHLDRPFQQWRIYPNPASNEMFIQGNYRPFAYKIIDTGGIEVSSGNAENSISIGSLKQGVYQLHILSTGQVIRFIKE